MESCYHNLAGEIGLAAGRAADAVRSFTSAESHYPRTVTMHGLARALTVQQDWTRARDAWTRVIDAQGPFFLEGRAADWVLAYLERGRAHRALGDQAAARRDYDRFLDLWSDGDSIRVVAEARKERPADR